MENNYKNIEDLMAVGESRLIKVFQSNEWDDATKSFKQGTHRTGTVKNGKNKGKIYWMYNTDVKYYDGDKERKCTIFAFDKKTKALFDTGEVMAVCKERVSYLADDFTEYPSVAMIEEENKTPLIVPNKETGVMEPACKKKVKVYFNPVTVEPKEDIPVIEDGEDIPDTVPNENIPF